VATAAARQQTTFARQVSKQGVGLHTGAECAARFLPAEADAGIVFVSKGVEVPATVDSVVSTERATTLGVGAAKVGGVEHLLAALWAMGVDNGRVEVEGPELPACDGSAAEWVALVRKAGRRRLGAAIANGELSHAVWVGGGDSWAVAVPASRLAVGVAVEYPGTAAGRQTLWLPLTGRRFAAEVAPARTFCLRQEYEELLAAGLARGGGLENAFVVLARPPCGGEAGGYSGPLRFPDEVVRHKALDVIGDISLCGRRFAAHIIAVRPSHGLNVDLARAVRAALRLRSGQALGPGASEGRRRGETGR
jgi:UDP-3-O-[3-hydroxymyristoyl] N-acetylglucosamine deacetylase